jgi:PEGA domain
MVTPSCATIAAAIVAAIVAFAGAARAAETPTSDAGEPAEAAIQRGIHLRKAGDDAGALPEFQNAYQLVHTPRAAAQLGFAEQALGHWDDAEGHLSEAVRTTGDPWVEKNRPALQKSLAAAKDHVGTLQITGEPEGAEVYVNGRRRGQIPMSNAVSVMAGDVDIEVRATGYKRTAQKVNIAAYQYWPLVVRLERIEGAVAAPRADVAATAGERGQGIAVRAPLELASAAPPTATAQAVPFEPAEAPSASLRAVLPMVGWSAAGAGAVVAAFGVYEALAGQSKIDAASSDADRANATADPRLYMNASAKFSDGSNQRTTGRVLIVVGGIVAAGGAILAVTTWRAPDAGGAVAHVEPSIQTDGGRRISTGLSVTGRW